MKNQSSQDPLNFPIKLNNKIAALQGVIESADARPTDQSQEVFKMLSDKLDVQVGKMDVNHQDRPAEARGPASEAEARTR